MSDSGVYLVGRHEIGVLLGRVSYRQVYEAIVSPGFPALVATLCNGEVWQQADVDAWIRRAETTTPGTRA